MYPHPIDRYRIASILLEHEMKKKGVTFSQIAEHISVSETTIRCLTKETFLEKQARRKRDAIKRTSLVQILGRGLKYRPKEIDVFLWLYRGEHEFEPINENEKHNHVEEEYARLSGCSDVVALRKRVLALLKEVLNEWISIPLDKPNNEMILDLTEGEELRSSRALLHMEREHGQRLNIMRYPSHLSHPADMFNHRIDRLISPIIKSKEARNEARRIKLERWNIFLGHLKDYGERCIYIKSGIERYLKEDFRHRLTLEERRAHIRNTIDLLDEYDHYEIAIADAELELEMEIKPTIGAIMRGAPGDQHWANKKIICGPRYIYWRDKTSAISFLLDFEREWDEIWNEIPKENRNKNYVIGQLEKMLAGERQDSSG